MIDANIRKLSRAELLYTCVAKMVLYFHKNGKDEFIKELEHYCSSKDYNRNFYHNTSLDTEEQLKAILADAGRLRSICGSDYEEVMEYQPLVRCFSEQTVVEEEVRQLRAKEGSACIPAYSRTLQTRRRPSGQRAERSNRGMWPIWRKRS